MRSNRQRSFPGFKNCCFTARVCSLRSLESFLTLEIIWKPTCSLGSLAFARLNIKECRTFWRIEWIWLNLHISFCRILAWCIPLGKADRPLEGPLISSYPCEYDFIITSTFDFDYPILSFMHFPLMIKTNGRNLKKGADISLCLPELNTDTGLG